MQDLSHLCGDIGTALVGGQSQAAGNTVNHPVTQVGPAPGSLPVNSPPAVSELDSPEIEVPPVHNYESKVGK
jgi:hypothetical protein